MDDVNAAIERLEKLEREAKSEVRNSGARVQHLEWMMELYDKGPALLECARALEGTECACPARPQFTNYDVKCARCAALAKLAEVGNAQAT